MILLYFLLWILLLYWIHRLAHILPLVKKYHFHHHKFVLQNKTGWHWSNIFLFNDDVKSTVDLWITEVIPTIFFCVITTQYWILVFYYIWAAFIQESIEHNEKVNLPILTSGKWHILHHHRPVNYGLFIPIWDMVFKTYKHV